MAPNKFQTDSEQTGTIWNIMGSEVLRKESAISNFLRLSVGKGEGWANLFSARCFVLV